jgi:hypothetical protein
MKTRLRFSLGALAATILTIGFASTALAVPASSARKPAVHAATGSQPSPAVVRSDSDGSHPCGTSFIPPDPRGAPMTEYYHNCTQGIYYVCPIYVGDFSSINSGTNVVYCENPVETPIESTVSWHFHSTYATGNYSAAFDVGGEATIEHGTTDKCWTSFVQGPGGTFTQYYHNCGKSSAEVCPLYIGNVNNINGGTNAAICGSDAQRAKSGATVSWYLEPPAGQTGEYTTAGDSTAP